MPFNEPRKIVINIPEVKCYQCGKVLSRVGIWAIHWSGVYCMGCAPVGSRLFAE